MKAVAAATKADPVSAKAVELHGMKGCEVNVQDPSSPQAARQYAITNGKVAVSVTCNHDKKLPQPEADAGCMAIVNGITLK
jgi:ribosomal protein S11